MVYVYLKIGDGTARFKRTALCSSAVNFFMLFSAIDTPSTPSLVPQKTSSEQVSLILRDFDSSQKKLFQMEKEILGHETIDLTSPNFVSELKLFLQRHQLPLGKDSRTGSGIAKMVASVGHSCGKSADLLSHYMLLTNIIRVL